MRRDGTTIGVIGNRIYVVGGSDRYSNPSNAVDYLEFNNDVSDEKSNVASVFGKASTWKTDKNLTLFNARRCHALVQVDSCLIVAGGHDHNGTSISVEVLDTERRAVWSLPNMSFDRYGFSITLLPDCVVAIGMNHPIESFPLLCRKQQLMNKYSCREELNVEMHRLDGIVKQVNDVKTTNVDNLEEAAQSEKLIPILQSLCTRKKFISGEELQIKIEKLQVEYKNAKNIHCKFPILKKIKKYEEMLEKRKTFATECERLGRICTLTKNALLGDEFYAKLVDTDHVNVYAKFHELVPLVSDVHKMRVYYTFVHHLYRSRNITDKERKHYIVAALQNAMKNISTMNQDEREILKIIHRKCSEDGIKDISITDDPTCALQSNRTQEIILRTDIFSSLSAFEFRIGRLSPVATSQTENKMDHLEEQIMVHVKSLGWSLRQLYSAYCQTSGDEVAIAAMCSIMNACPRCTDERLEESRQEEGETTGMVSSQIIDFGDVEHMASVVQQTGSSSLQRAWDEGIQPRLA